MKSRWTLSGACLALLALVTIAFSAAAGAGNAPARTMDQRIAEPAMSHNLPGPMTKEFEARREAALELKLHGGARGEVVQLGKNKYVELVREKTDPVFVVIAEFGNARHSSFCDAVVNPTPPQPCAFPSDGSPQTYDGPEHNKIPRRTARSTTRPCGSPTTTSGTTRTCTSTG